MIFVYSTKEKQIQLTNHSHLSIWSTREIFQVQGAFCNKVTHSEKVKGSFYEPRQLPSAVGRHARPKDRKQEPATRKSVGGNRAAGNYARAGGIAAILKRSLEKLVRAGVHNDYYRAIRNVPRLPVY